MKRMFIVGGDAFLVTAIRVALRFAAGINVLGVRDDSTGVLDAIRDTEPDVVLVDATSDRDRALEVLRAVRRERPHTLLIVVSPELDVELFEEAGALGALVCLGTSALLGQLATLLAEPGDRAADASALVGVDVDARGAEVEMAPLPAVEPECPLTKREMEILRAVAEGHTNARIGRDLWVTEQTVKFHLSKIYRKLGVANRTEASRYVLLKDPFGARRAARQVALANGNGHAASNGHANGNGHAASNGHHPGANQHLINAARR